MVLLALRIQLGLMGLEVHLDQQVQVDLTDQMGHFHQLLPAALVHPADQDCLEGLVILDLPVDRLDLEVRYFQPGLDLRKDQKVLQDLVDLIVLGFLPVRCHQELRLHLLDRGTQAFRGIQSVLLLRYRPCFLLVLLVRRLRAVQEHLTVLEDRYFPMVR